MWVWQAACLEANVLVLSNQKKSIKWKDNLAESELTASSRWKKCFKNFWKTKITKLVEGRWPKQPQLKLVSPVSIYTLVHFFTKLHQRLRLSAIHRERERERIMGLPPPLRKFLSFYFINLTGFATTKLLLRWCPPLNLGSLCVWGWRTVYTWFKNRRALWLMLGIIWQHGHMKNTHTQTCTCM